MADLLQKLLPETVPPAWLFLFLLFLVVSVQYWFTGKFGTKRRQRFPPSPQALPIIGHLHLIGSLPHVSLRSLARKHGPDMMLLRLGAVPTLVVSSPCAAEAVLRTHDHVLASRPHSVVSDTIMYGSFDIGFAPYGEYWRQARKLVTTHMLSVKKVQSFRGAAAEEVLIFNCLAIWTRWLTIFFMILLSLFSYKFGLYDQKQNKGKGLSCRPVLTVTHSVQSFARSLCLTLIIKLINKI